VRTVIGKNCDVCARDKKHVRLHDVVFAEIDIRRRDKHAAESMLLHVIA
jgi:glutaredoxin